LTGTVLGNVHDVVTLKHGDEPPLVRPLCHARTLTAALRFSCFPAQPLTANREWSRLSGVVLPLCAFPSGWSPQGEAAGMKRNWRRGYGDHGPIRSL
jgi:hypothetical protein